MATIRVLIAGAGALGLYYGGRLAAAGQDVVFLARGENLAALRAHGLRAASIRGDFSSPVNAVGSVEAAAAHGAYDLILVTLKSYQTTPEFLRTLLPAVGSATRILTLQNGVESARPLEAIFGAGRVIAGIAFIGAERVAPGIVAHTAAGHVVIGQPGEPNGDAEATGWAARLAAVFQAAGIDIKVSEDIRGEQWRKLVWNAPFNGMTALTGSFAHDILTIPDGRAMVEAAMHEVIYVARAQGIALPLGTAEETMALTLVAGPVRTSMLVDRELGRPLEHDALYGPPIRIGKELGVATPTLQHIHTLLQILDATRNGASIPS
jgi:2-dehydropantoate 2-reductase